MHVREIALPAPGDDGQLGEQLTRPHQRPLDRRRALPLYLCGAEVLGWFPISVISDVSGGLNITVLSCNGGVDVGIVACRDRVPDVGTSSTTWARRSGSCWSSGPPRHDQQLHERP